MHRCTNGAVTSLGISNFFTLAVFVLTFQAEIDMPIWIKFSLPIIINLQFESDLERNMTAYFGSVDLPQ